MLLNGMVGLGLAGLVVLVTGHLSALVFNGGWPRFAAREVPGIFWRLASDLDDPGHAWEPVNGGADLPGPMAWWSTCVVILVGAGLPAWWAARRWVDAEGGSKGARWARGRELGQLRSGQLVVGKAGGRRVTVEARHSLLVFGPTQSGKTTGLAIPAILEWDGPVVATSTKGDLVADTIGWRAGQGRVQVFDPAGATAFEAAGWSPLARCETWAGATRTAWELAMAAKAATGQDASLAGFWFGSAAKSLAPYLFAAARVGFGMDRVARWIDAEEHDELIAILRLLNEDAVLAHEATFRRELRARSSLFQVMQQVASPYLDPLVAASAERHEIVPEDLLDGGAHTLYVSAPHHDQARFRPLFAMLVGQIITAIYERVARTGAPLERPVLLVLDEAANIAPVEDLPTLASTAAAMGLQLVTVFQDLAQVKTRYGQTSGTVVNNHRAKLILPGVSDLETLDLVSRLAGEEEVSRRSVTSDQGGRRSSTTSSQWRRLAPAEAVRQIPSGRGVLVYGNLPPVRLRLRPWYSNQKLRHAAGLSGTWLRPSERPDATPATGDRQLATAETSTSERPNGASASASAGSPMSAVDAARRRLRLVPPDTDVPDGES
jgi:type IV secretion system protein VirD4